jgi:methionyl-tRNA formyltransferase
MKILYLGPTRPDMINYLLSLGDIVVCTEDKIDSNSKTLGEVDFLISYGYRHLIKEDVLIKFPKKVINLHISFLPWNRGADPNLWSFLEDTPKGVTIHYIDAGLDTGEILAQQELLCYPNDTLQTSYQRLIAAIEELFMRVWPEIREGKRKSFPQTSGGSSHRLKDRTSVEYLLSKGWDTPVSELVGRSLSLKQEV